MFGGLGSPIAKTAACYCDFAKPNEMRACNSYVLRSCSRESSESTNLWLILFFFCFTYVFQWAETHEVLFSFGLE